MKKKVLVIVAHPDDEVIGCGGYLAKLKSEGCKIYAVHFTDGETARKSSGLNDINYRKSCALRASKIIGYQWIHKYCGIFLDQRLDALPLLELVQKIEDIKKQIKPDIVITHSNKDLNLDHRIIFEAALTAFRPKFSENCKMILSFEIPSATDYGVSLSRENFIPNLSIDISKFWNKKKKALLAYKKELQKYPNSLSLRGIEILNRLRGVQSGLQIAEGFEIIRKIEK